MRSLDPTKVALHYSRRVSYLRVGGLKVGIPTVQVATQRATLITVVQRAAARKVGHLHRRQERYVRRFHPSLPFCALAVPSLWFVYEFAVNSFLMQCHSAEQLLGSYNVHTFTLVSSTRSLTSRYVLSAR